MLRSRKLLSLLVLALVVTLLSCGSAHDADEHYFFVAANLQVPYWQAAGAGFSKADVYPSNLLASFLVVPWQTVLAKLRKPYQGSALLTLRMWCDKLDRLLPGGVRRRYAPSIAIVAQK